MIIQHETTLDVLYYLNVETSEIMMSVENYCYFVGIPISLGLDRKPKTTKIDLRITPILIPGCTPKNSVSVKVLNQKTIIEWLLEDNPELLGKILSKGLGQYLEKFNIT